MFTTFFTNGYGIASGLVGSLGYWLKQQSVERGSQPEYYYAVMVAMYEYLPWLLASTAAVFAAVRLILGRSLDPREPLAGRSLSDDADETEEGESAVGQVLAQAGAAFVPFLLFWVVAAWVAYSVAGERMPWLTVHIALPMILLSGWLVGRFIDAVDWREVLRRRAWLILLVVPPLLMAIYALVRGIVAVPFQGLELEELRSTGRFLGALAGTLGFGAGLLYLVWRTGWRGALATITVALLLIPTLLTIRTAWRFAFINYDYATEHLVYAHAAPGVHEAMRRLGELSSRVAGGPEEIGVAYGSDGSTLWYWQLRNFTNAVHFGEQPSREQMELPVVIAGSDQWEVVSPYLGDDYVYDTYTYIWWPVEDYRNLTVERITHAITDTETRAALWDIWYDRDYRRYQEVTGRVHSVDKWPLRQDFRMYVRRDIQSQIWDQGAVSAFSGGEEGQSDPYETAWVLRTARLIVGTEGAGEGQLQGPRGVAVDSDGFIYVAELGQSPHPEVCTGWPGRGSIRRAVVCR